MSLKATIRFLVVIVSFWLISLPCFEKSMAQDMDDSGSSSAAKLKELEEKAQAHDFAIRRSESLQQDLNRLKLALTTTQGQLTDMRAKYNPGRLLELEKKAMAYGYLKDQVNLQDRKIQELERQLAEEKCLTTLQAEEILKLKAGTANSTQKEDELTKQIKDLNEVIYQLKRGNYEYYEVKEGDTVESIAALPMIYGDESKAEQLRQWNKDQVNDVANLKAGEVLLIPRFKHSGVYQW